MEALSSLNVITVDSSSKARPLFCASGCLKCSPASLSLRSVELSSSLRSECSFSSSNASHLSSWRGVNVKNKYGFCEAFVNLPLKPLKGVRGSNDGAMGRKVLSEAIRNSSERVSGPEMSVGEEVFVETSRGVLMDGRGLSTGNGTTASLAEENIKTSANETRKSLADIQVSVENGRVNGDVDELWLTIQEEVRAESVKEPVLASYFYSSVISHRCVLSPS